MIDPLDLRRLALRIETLQRQSTHGWDSADEMEFNAKLKNPRNPQGLPRPDLLREMADGKIEQPSMGQYQSWLTWTRNMEDLVRDNRPGSPKHLIREWSRGRLPGMR